MGYESKGQMTGQYRSLGAPPEMIAMAQEELRLNFAASEMNEKIFAGKLLELRGRTLVASRGHGTTQVDVKANQNRGQALLAETVGYPHPVPKSKAKSKPKAAPSTRLTAARTTPSTMTPSTASTRSLSMTPPRSPPMVEIVEDAVIEVDEIEEATIEAASRAASMPPVFRMNAGE